MVISNNSNSPITFAPALSRLGHALLPSSSNSSSATKHDHQTCALTLLRILDNVLNDPVNSNPKLRKIKVSNPAFWKRAGRWDGSVEFLKLCGFVVVGSKGVKDSGGRVDTGKEERKDTLPAHLKLEDEDRERLFWGRGEMTKFAVFELGMEGSDLPKCAALMEGANRKSGTVASSKDEIAKNDTNNNTSRAYPLATSFPSSTKTKPFEPPTSSSIANNKIQANKEAILSHNGLAIGAPNNCYDARGNQLEDAKNACAAKKSGSRSHLPATTTRSRQQSHTSLLTLEEIQMLSQKEREASLVEARLLEEEEQAREVASRQYRTAEVELERQRKAKLLAEGQGREQGRCQQVATERAKLECEHKLEKEAKTDLSSVCASTSANRVQNDEKGSARLTGKPEAKLSLSNEMTDLLDEIELELNGSFFGDSTGNADNYTETCKTNADDLADLISMPVSEPENQGLEEEMAQSQAYRDKISVVDWQVRHGQKQALEEENAPCTSDLDTDMIHGTEGGDPGVAGRCGSDELELVQLPENVEELMLGESPCVGDGQVDHGAREHDFQGAAINNANIDESADSGHNKSASGLLDDLDSEMGTKESSRAISSFFDEPASSSGGDLQEQLAQRIVQSKKISKMQNVNLAQMGYDGGEAISSHDDELQKEAAHHSSSGNTDDGDDEEPAMPPPSSRQHRQRQQQRHEQRDQQEHIHQQFNGNNMNNSYSKLFHNIPLPEGEFSSSDGEDVINFRLGFELCHRALLSICPPDRSDGNDRSAKPARRRLRRKVDHAASMVAGLSNLTELKKRSDQDVLPPGESPLVILVPLHVAYVVWARILGLSFTVNDDGVCLGDGMSVKTNDGCAGVQSGMMYSWVVSNHQQLGVVDNIPLNNHGASTHLPHSSTAVCNYVCKVLWDISMIGIYRANLTEVTTTMAAIPSLKMVFFVGINRNDLKDCVRKRVGNDIGLDGTLLSKCHGTLANLVYLEVLDVLSSRNLGRDANKNDKCDPLSLSKNNHEDRGALIWYSCHYSCHHLIACSRLDDAMSLLSDEGFARLRLRYMGLRAGASAHCHDCDSISVHLKRSCEGLRGERLQVVGNNCMKLCDLFTNPYASPDIDQWKEDHFAILCCISTMLREKAEEVITIAPPPAFDAGRQWYDSGEELRRGRQLKKDIGESLQLIGEHIGFIGVHPTQEIEHYEQALQLKSAAVGEGAEDDDSVADVLYVMGCHHQRHNRHKLAQKCYERALRIYKATCGHESLEVARLLHNIGIMYHAKGDDEVALRCLKKCLSIRMSSSSSSSSRQEIEAESNGLDIADAYCWIGKIHREKHAFAAALECFKKAHKIKVDVLGKTHIESAEALHNVGIVCDDLGMNSQSLSCFREALLIRLTHISGTFDVVGINDVCETLDCIANVYRIKGEHQKALQFFDQCLKRRVRIVSSAALTDDKTQVSLLLSTYEDVIAMTKLQGNCMKNNTSDDMLNKIGSLLVETGLLYDHRLNKSTKALAYLQKALQAFQQRKNYEQIGNTLSLIGVIHVKRNANKKALKCFLDSLVMQKMSSARKETAGIAETHHNIGNCKARDGQFESSLCSYREALRVKKMIFSPGEHENVSIAKTEHCMGLAMLQLGELNDALELFEKSMKVRRKLLGNHHLDVSFSLHSLGRIYFHQNKVDKAIDCLREALEIKQLKLSEKHMSLAETQHLLGSLYIRKQAVAAAVPLLKLALVAYRSSRGDCEIIKSDVLDLLGNSYAQLGEDEHAILSYEHSLKIKKVVVGKDHVACANVLMEIGKLKSSSDNIDGALVAFKEVKRIQKIIYGKNHMKNTELLIQVGLIQDRLNNNDMAFRCFTEALRMRRKLLGKNHRGIAEALVHVGRMHQGKDDHFKSLAFFQEAIDIYHESDGDNMSQDCADACHLLGLSQIASGDNKNALHSLERCLEVLEHTHGSESEQWAKAAYDLGIAKCEMGLLDDAAVLLDNFVLLQKSFENTDSESLSNALLHLGKICLKKRSIDNAMVYFDETLAIRKQMSNNELGVSEVLFQIGGVRELKKQYLESLVCYEESLKLRLSVSGEDEDTADIVSRIGEVRRIRGQYDLALENFTLALDMYKSTVGETHLNVANTYHSLGYVCDAKRDTQKAMQNHKEGLSVRKLILGGNHVKVASSLDDVAGMYQKQYEQKKALKCLKEALRIRKLQLGNDDIEIGKTLFGMGIIFAAIDDKEKAEECYSASLDISARLGTNPKLEAQTLHQIGCLHAAKCNYRKALQNWRTCLSKYREGGLRDDHYVVACTLGNIEMAENVLNTHTHGPITS